MKLFKNNQHGISLLSKIKPFLTKMVQMRGCFLTTYINDIHEDKNIKQMRRYRQETGRSMVEMLGVLAIIGVLSVGGIAGYSKAMFKYKVNKAINQVAIMAQSVRNYFANQPSYEGLVNNIDFLKTILSPEMIDEKSTIVSYDTGGTSYIKSPFDHGIFIKDDTYSKKAFTINYFNISSAECLALATVDWSSIGGVIGVNARNSHYTDPVGESENCPFSPNGIISESDITGCPGGATVPIPIPMSLALKACECESERSCSIVLSFE